MKKLVALAIALLMALVFTGCQTSAGDNTASNPESAGTTESVASSGNSETAEVTFDGTYKVGVFMPLTGNSSLMGQAGVDAVNLAASQINAAGGILGKEVVVASYDDQSSPEEAVNCVNKMLEIDQVDAIIGSLHSGNIQAVGDIVEQAKIPMLGSGTSPQWLQKGWTYLFRDTINTYYTSLAAIDACDTLNVKSISIFHSQDEYGKNGKDNMISLCEEHGINVIDVESMTPGDSDFTAQVANLKKSGADATYIIATTDNLPAMVKQLRAGGVDGYVIGEQSLGAPEVKEVAGSAADGLVYGACFIMPQTDPSEAQFPNLIQFFQDYKDMYGRMCQSEVAVRCYDGMFLLKKAVEAAGSTDGTAVRDAMYTISDYEGLQGTFDFTQSHDGEGLTSCRLYITENGKDVLLDDYLASK